jgi:hypothetical protein
VSTIEDSDLEWEKRSDGFANNIVNVFPLVRARDTVNSQMARRNPIELVFAVARQIIRSESKADPFSGFHLAWV